MCVSRLGCSFAQPCHRIKAGETEDGEETTYGRTTVLCDQGSTSTEIEESCRVPCFTSSDTGGQEPSVSGYAMGRLMNTVWVMPCFYLLVCEFVLHLARDCIDYIRRFYSFVLMSLLALLHLRSARCSLLRRLNTDNDSFCVSFFILRPRESYEEAIASNLSHVQGVTVGLIKAGLA